MYRAGRGHTVVVAGVVQVLLERCNGAQAGDGCLGGEAEEGNHGQAGVLHLLLPHLLAAHAQGVEGGLVQEAGLHEAQQISQCPGHLTGCDRDAARGGGGGVVGVLRV